MFRVLHHSHDSRVTRIHRQFFGTDVQGSITVYRARKHLRPWRLCNLEWFTREVGFIHLSMTLDDRAIDRANLMWKYDERVPDRYVSENYIRQIGTAFPMSDLRHPFG